jgi:hypothetical protein
MTVPWQCRGCRGSVRPPLSILICREVTVRADVAADLANLADPEGFAVLSGFADVADFADLADLADAAGPVQGVVFAAGTNALATRLP